jgi:single-stranded-DNA-specific exonuclease
MRNRLTKVWKPKPLPSEEIINTLIAELKTSKLLATIMAQRNITCHEEGRKFFAPKRSDLYDPFLMKNMDIAVKRIIQAFESNERILLYGDYDVDGTTAVSLLLNYFTPIHPNLDFYIPDRFNEGYGLSVGGVQKAIDENTGLIITLDCGIKDLANIKLAKDNGIDVIVCDHHTVGETLPEAFAILNPKQADCSYPFKELTGCGIGFKLLQAYHQKVEGSRDPIQYVDFVAVSTASDIVPIVDENRVLTSLGLHVINTHPHIAFKTMIQNSALKRELNVSDLVFIIGPRLNASGRVDHARDTVLLLTSKSGREASEAAETINKNNTERKDIDQNITNQALQMIENDPAQKEMMSSVVFDPSWHKGVVGIVASRLIENYYRPTVVLTESEGLLVGSARSIPGFDLYQALEKCRHLFVKFGGHQYAAGLTLKHEDLDAFRVEFEKIARGNITPDMMLPTLDYDLELNLHQINEKLVRSLQKFAPFGPGNMKPRFISRDLRTAFAPKVVGSNHLKLVVTDGNSSTFDAIAYNMGDLIGNFVNGNKFDICYSLDENYWNDRVTIQLNIKDIKFN